MPKKRKRTAKLVSCGNEEKENGKDLRKRPSAGCLTDGSNLSTSPSEIQQQQHISEHHTPSRSRLSPYPVHMMYQGPLGESTPNAAQDIENSLFGFDWSTPLIASPSIVSPSIVSSPLLSPIVSSYATPRKKSKLSRNALQDTPLSSRMHQQVEAKRKPKAATPKKRYVVYDMPVQPLKVNRNDKPRKNNWKAAELEEWMKKVNAEFAEIEKHELAVVYDK